MTQLWSYNGEFILRSAYGEVYVRGQLHESVDYHQEPGISANGHVEVRMTEGLHHWGGVARVQGVPRGLRDVLGEECKLILPTGEEGKTWVTAYSDESAWVIEVQGAGPLPSLPSSDDGGCFGDGRCMCGCIPGNCPPGYLEGS